jgi:hypothetical protein
MSFTKSEGLSPDRTGNFPPPQLEGAEYGVFQYTNRPGEVTCEQYDKKLI